MLLNQRNTIKMLCIWVYLYIYIHAQYINSKDALYRNSSPPLAVSNANKDKAL